MKAYNAQQEILLVIETNFSSMLWSDSNRSSAGFTSQNDSIEDDCWNSILNEMLPGLGEVQCSKQDLYLCEIRTFDHILKLCFAESIFERDNYLTIDPYLFRKILAYN